MLWRSLLAASLVAAAAFAVGVVLDLPLLRLAVKPVPVVALAIWAVTSSPAGLYRRWILAGLAASLAGDLFLEIAPRELFVAGLGSFLLAHLFYVLAYRTDGRLLHPLRALPAYAYGVLVLGLLAPGLGSMAIPVGLYTAVICTMLWRAAARIGSAPERSAHLSLAGALTFAASDSMIALGRFGGHLLAEPVRTGWPLRLAIMATYWLGQWGITASTRKPSPT